MCVLLLISIRVARIGHPQRHMNTSCTGDIVLGSRVRSLVIGKRLTPKRNKTPWHSAQTVLRPAVLSECQQLTVDAQTSKRKVRRLSRNSPVHNRINWRWPLPNFTQIDQQIELFVEINLRPYVKWAHSDESHSCFTIFCNERLRKLHENLTNGLDADTRSQKYGQTDGRSFFTSLIAEIRETEWRQSSDLHRGHSRRSTCGLWHGRAAVACVSL